MCTYTCADVTCAYVHMYVYIYLCTYTSTNVIPRENASECRSLHVYVHVLHKRVRIHKHKRITSEKTTFNASYVINKCGNQFLHIKHIRLHIHKHKRDTSEKRHSMPYCLKRVRNWFEVPPYKCEADTKLSPHCMNCDSVISCAAIPEDVATAMEPP